MSFKLIKYLYKVDYKAQLKALEEQLQNKPVIIYGTGRFFELICQSYDMSGFNILGVADKKFKEKDKEFLGYPVIQIKDIKKHNPYCLLVATFTYVGLIEVLERETFKNCGFKIQPLILKKYIKYEYLPKNWRDLIYAKEFFKNMFRYVFKKVPMQKLQIWTGQSCSLRCKNCSQLFPYIKPKLYDIDKVIKDTKKVLKHAKPESLHIIGGEPFLNKDIDKLIEFVAQTNPTGDNKIISNGTIIPSERVLSVLQKYKNSIRITVSQYSCVEEKQKDFMEKMKECNIKCTYVSSDAPWFYCGDNTQEEIVEEEELYKNFECCWDRTCYTIADGKLSICPRMHNSPMVFEEKSKFIENLPLKFIGNCFLSKALIATALTNETYREACRHCFGVSSVNNMYCVRGEQLEKR